MKLTVTQEVDVSLTPFCKNCFRLGIDEYNNRICELFGRFVYMHNGHYLKCRECYNALYDEIEKKEI